MSEKAEFVAQDLGSCQRLGFRSSRVRFLRALVNKRSERESSGCFVIEGEVALGVALNSGARLREVFVDCDAVFGQHVRDAQARGVTVSILDSGVMNRVASTVTPQPVIAIVERRSAALEDISDGPVVVLVDVSDPGNAGTIIRSAEAAGMSAVITCGHSVDVYSPKVVRSAASALFEIAHVTATDTAQTLISLRSRGYKIWGTRMQDAVPYWDADLTGNVAILVGNEAHGLPTDLHVDNWVSIPMQGNAESLNAAVAASIICFEISRQEAHQ